MAIRAVDMQIMMPRMADLSVMHQSEKERPILEQLQMVSEQKKQVENEKQVVRKTNRHNQMKNDADAKEKGKNSYTYHPGKHSKANIQKEKAGSFPDGEHVDIKI